MQIFTLRSTALALVALSGVVVACGSESTLTDGAGTRSPTPNDVGGTGSPAGPSPANSSGGVGSSGSGDAGPLDPATCSVGPTDGCCPLAIEYGGSDPDCASAACTVSTKGAPIALHAPIDVWLGQVAMAWTGHDLVLASTRETYDVATTGNYTDLVVQRRDGTGATIGADVTRRIALNPPGTASTELRVDGASGDLLFAWQARLTQQYQVARLPPSGDPTWTAILGFGCNDDGGAVRIFPDNGELVVGMAQDACAGTFRPWVRAYDATTGQDSVSQAHLGMFDLGDGDRPDLLGGAGLVFHPTTRKLDVFYGRHYEGDLRTRALDFGAQTKAASSTAVLSAVGDHHDYDPFVAFDGSQYAIATQEDDFGSPYGSFVLRLYTGTAVTKTTLLATFPGATTRTAPPSIIWTGQGYVVAIPYAVKQPNGDVHRLDRATRIVRLDASGTVLETFELDAQPSILAKLALAGGRVAITWVRPSGPFGGTSQSFLRWLDCSQ